MSKRDYSEQEKAGALALLEDLSLTFYEVRDMTGISVGTLCRWAEAAGLKRSDEKTRAASERRKTRLAAKREALAEKMLDVADEFVDHAKDIAAGVVEVRDGVFVSGGRDARELMTAAAIALDKFRLEMGESTAINESRDTNGTRKKLVERLDQVAAKRAERAAS